MKFVVATLFVTCVVLFNFIELSTAMDYRENYEGAGVQPGTSREHLGQKPGLRTDIKKKFQQSKIYHLYQNQSGQVKQSYRHLKSKLPFKHNKPTNNNAPPSGSHQNNYPPMGGPGYPYPGAGFPGAGF